MSYLKELKEIPQVFDQHLGDSLQHSFTLRYVVFLLCPLPVHVVYVNTFCLCGTSGPIRQIAAVVVAFSAPRESGETQGSNEGNKYAHMT